MNAFSVIRHSFAVASDGAAVELTTVVHARRVFVVGTNGGPGRIDWRGVERVVNGAPA